MIKLLFAGMLIAGGVILWCGSDIILAKTKKLCYGLIGVGAVGLLFSLCVCVIPTGYTGVKTTADQISDTPLQPGVVFNIPLVQKVTLVNNKRQDAHLSDEIWGETSEKIQVYGKDITVTYSIAPERSVWILSNVSNGTSLMSKELLGSPIKNAMVKFDAENVTTRENIEPAAKAAINAALAEKYGEDTVIVHKVVIGQMDFEPSYSAAIADKASAAKRRETQAYENEIELSKARTAKEKAILQAEQSAEAVRIKAEADAKAKQIAADAEAKANETIRASLSEEVMKAKFYEKWNGQLPKVMGENAAIVDIGE